MCSFKFIVNNISTLRCESVEVKKDIKACYQRLREAGKPAKVALTACMRKLILMANALLRDQRMWDAGARYALESKPEININHSASNGALTLSA